MLFSVALQSWVHTWEDSQVETRNRPDNTLSVYTTSPSVSCLGEIGLTAQSQGCMCLLTTHGRAMGHVPAGVYVGAGASFPALPSHLSLPMVPWIRCLKHRQIVPPKLTLSTQVPGVTSLYSTLVFSWQL